MFIEGNLASPSVLHMMKRALPLVNSPSSLAEIFIIFLVKNLINFIDGFFIKIPTTEECFSHELFPRLDLSVYSDNKWHLLTSCRAFLSIVLLLWSVLITFLAPSTTAASIRNRWRNSSILSSSDDSSCSADLVSPFSDDAWEWRQTIHSLKYLIQST